MISGVPLPLFPAKSPVAGDIGAPLALARQVVLMASAEEQLVRVRSAHRGTNLVNSGLRCENEAQGSWDGCSLGSGRNK